MVKKRELSASMEDYLEAILQIIEEKGEVRSRDIMEKLNVTGPSVTEAFQQLGERELIHYVPYEAITLTPAGKEIAQEILGRHIALRDFFSKILLVDYEIADDGACKMEHVVSQRIVDRMVKYAEYLKIHGEEQEFAQFLDNKEVK